MSIYAGLEVERRRAYDSVGFATLARMGDIYQLFYERGCQLLQTPNGILAYITSNSWLRVEYGKSLRRYFAENHTPVMLLELGKDVFESAIVDSGILILRTGAAAHPFSAIDMDRVNSSEVPPPDELWGQVCPDGDAPWSIMSVVEQSVLNKMRVVGTPLKDWDVTIRVGIITGLNTAFIIDGETRANLVGSDPKSAEIIIPVMRGRDIQRWCAEWAGLYLIASHNGYRTFPPSTLPNTLPSRSIWMPITHNWRSDMTKAGRRTIYAIASIMRNSPRKNSSGSNS